MKTRSICYLLSVLCCAALPAASQAQFAYTTNSSGITIFYYAGTNSVVTIPGSIDGQPVTRIGYEAFCRNYKVTSVTIPDSVTAIEDGGWFTDMVYGDYHGAFYGSGLTNITLGTNLTTVGKLAFHGCPLKNITVPASVTAIGGGSRLNRDEQRIDYLGAFTSCANLTGVYCKGNVPIGDSTVFDGANSATVYYLPGKSGWSATFAGRPAVLWKPRVTTGDGNLGVQTNQFGFNIAWVSGQTVVVEASTNAANPNWSALKTNVLTTDTSYFSDPQWTNYPARFYRLRSP